MRKGPISGVVFARTVDVLRQSSDVPFIAVLVWYNFRIRNNQDALKIGIRIDFGIAFQLFNPVGF